MLCPEFRRVVVGHDTGGQRGQCIRPDAKARSSADLLSRLDPRRRWKVAHNQDGRFANRFAVLGLAADEDEGNRRAMPVSPPPESVVDALKFDMTRGDSDSDEVVNSTRTGSDVENVDLEWGSEVSGEEIPVPEDRVHQGRVGVVGHSLFDEFTRRAAVMKSVPHFLRGPYRNAMRLAMEEATHVVPGRSERGWRLFLLLPRLLLHRPPTRGNIHKNKLAQRFRGWQVTQSDEMERDELPVPSLWFKWVSCRQAARRWKVLLLRQAMSKLSIPSVTLSGGRHVPGIPFLVTYWSISRRSPVCGESSYPTQRRSCRRA